MPSPIFCSCEPGRSPAADSGFLGLGVCIDNRHVRNKAIATFWKSLDVSRILSRVPQRTSEFRDGDVESLVEITKTFVRSRLGRAIPPW